MKSGKLSNEQLSANILESISYKRDEVLIRPGIGEDCTALDFGEYGCILSTDPITGTAEEVGKLAVHITCNDIATSGVAPLGLMLTILAPEGTTVDEITYVMKQACEEAAKLKVEIIGGHTEVTSAVNRIVISATAIGKQLKDSIVKTAGVVPGQSVVMTKYAGIEGTGIIAHEKCEELRSLFTDEEIDEALSYLDMISVIPEGEICGAFGVSSMHDVTEGGVMGAIWEVCEASGVGCRLNFKDIIIPEVTKKICKHFDIEPLKLISSGAMLISVDSDRAEALIKRLRNEDIPASIIGEFTENTSKELVCDEGVVAIESPESDELYKVVT